MHDILYYGDPMGLLNYAKIQVRALVESLYFRF